MSKVTPRLPYINKINQLTQQHHIHASTTPSQSPAA